jgi:hypothetical protein
MIGNMKLYFNELFHFIIYDIIDVMECNKINISFVSGGLTWAFNTQLYIEEYYPDFNPGIWVAVDSIVGGR